MDRFGHSQPDGFLNITRRFNNTKEPITIIYTDSTASSSEEKFKTGCITDRLSEVPDLETTELT
jgi:hypothetical protein